MQCPLQGSLVALPTPFSGNAIDYGALDHWIEFQIQSGTDGLVVGGTTGEASTLNEREHKQLIRAAVKRAAGRAAIVAGVGTNNTSETVERARMAASCGVTALMVVTPYYNRPEPRGLMEHFGRVAESTSAPIMLYNVPSRTGVDLTPELACAIADRFENVVALKEANGDPARVRSVASLSGLAVFGGEDAVMADFMQHGARGVVSVVGNLLPTVVAEILRESGPGGDAVRAALLVGRIAALVRELFSEVNPVPVKAALSMTTGSQPDVRLPLVGLGAANRERLLTTLRAVGLETVAGAGRG